LVEYTFVVVEGRATAQTSQNGGKGSGGE